MDIRIPSGPPATPDVPATDGATSEAAAAGAPGGIGTVGADAVQRVVDDLAAGRITRGEAVDRLVQGALDGKMAQAVPSEVRAEIAQALRALVETDPHLASLASGLSRGEGR
ncbi:MAG: hypothetical protein PHU25_01950 [Deltaproteobacteria bacterium]|nr:hypothetical protein [Deltaproteobacteria bacterium]